MSSPVHHANDVEAAYVYAPPWARRQTLPVAVTPPLLPSRRVNAARGTFSGDYAMLELQRQLALDPDAVPEPPTQADRRLWSVLRPMALRLGAASAVAALMAWGMILLPSLKKAQAIVPPDAPPVQVSANRVKPVHVDFVTPTPQLVPEKFVATAAPAPVAAAAAAPVIQASTSAPATASSTPSQPADNPPQLGNDEIAMLVKRGKDFLVNGDLASARLLLRRAADNGSAEGALALGATFDPLIIRQLGAVGAVADAAKARSWYQKAAQLGSPTASQQLAKLEQAPQ